MNYEYDVVFSLAGEQKDYVEKVAKYILDEGIRVWFYKFEETETWGKNQIDVFSEIFTIKAKYCVIFISREYTEKVWPNLERQFIQSRWLKDPDYMLPARFDDSLVIGIPDTMAYVSLEGKKPEDFGEIIIKKIKGQKRKIEDSKAAYRQPKIKKEFDPLKLRNEWIFHIIEDLEKRCKQTQGLMLTHDEIEGVMHLRVTLDSKVIYSMNIYKKAFSPGDSGISFSASSGELSSFSGTNATGEFIWSKEKNDIVLKLLDLSLLSSFTSSGDKLLTKKEFMDALWDRICDLIERDY